MDFHMELADSAILQHWKCSQWWKIFNWTFLIQSNNVFAFCNWILRFVLPSMHWPKVASLLKQNILLKGFFAPIKCKFCAFWSFAIRQKWQSCFGSFSRKMKTLLIAMQNLHMNWKIEVTLVFQQKTFPFLQNVNWNGSNALTVSNNFDQFTMSITDHSISWNFVQVVSASMVKSRRLFVMHGWSFDWSLCLVKVFHFCESFQLCIHKEIWSSWTGTHEPLLAITLSQEKWHFVSVWIVQESMVVHGMVVVAQIFANELWNGFGLAGNLEAQQSKWCDKREFLVQRRVKTDVLIFLKFQFEGLLRWTESNRAHEWWLTKNLWGARLFFPDLRDVNRALVLSLGGVPNP